MDQLSTDIAILCESAIRKEIFPGCVVGVVDLQQRKIVLPSGRFMYHSSSKLVTKSTVYDVASVTKSIPTSLLALKLIEEKKLSLRDQLIRFVPQYVGSYRKDITIAHLLTQTLSFSFSLSSLRSSDEILYQIFHAALTKKPGMHYGYANATSILLGMVIEKVAKAKLPTLANDIFFSPLGMDSSTFYPREPTSIPPTERVGRKITQGIVHDESAQILFENDILTGSAGLFSNCSDLLSILQMLLLGGKFASKQLFRQATIDLMVQKRLGWQFDQAWMGKKHSQKAFGKTGFTGCFVFVDIEKGIGICFLANHIYPKRQATKDSINRFRAGLVDLVLSSRMV